MTSPRSLGRSALMTAVGLATIGVVRIAAGILAERAFGVVGLALLATGIGIATNATIVGSAGASSGLTKLLAERSGGAAASFRAFASRWLLLLTGLGAVGGAVYARFDPTIDAAPRGAFAAVAGLAIVFGAYQAGKAIAYGDDRLPSYVRREILGAVMFGVGAALAIVADNPSLILVALAAAYLPVAIFTIEAQPWRRYPESPPAREFLQYGVIGSIGSLAGIGFTRLTPIAAGFAAGVAGSAVVGGALILLEPLYLAPRSIGLALLPRLARDRAAGAMEQAGNDIRSATGVTAAATLPVCAALALFPDQISSVFFNEVRGGLTLAIFAGAFFVSVVGAPSITALSAISPRTGSIAMWSSLAGFVVAIGLWFALGPAWGVEAIAFGYLVGSVIQIVAPAIVATRRFSVHWSSFPVRVLVIVGVIVAASIQGEAWSGISALVLSLVGLAPEYRDALRLVFHR